MSNVIAFIYSLLLTKEYLISRLVSLKQLKLKLQFENKPVDKDLNKIINIIDLALTKQTAKHN